MRSFHPSHLPRPPLFQSSFRQETSKLSLDRNWSPASDDLDAGRVAADADAPANRPPTFSPPLRDGPRGLAALHGGPRPAALHVRGPPVLAAPHGRPSGSRHLSRTAP